MTIFWSLYGAALFGYGASGNGDTMGDGMGDATGHHSSPGEVGVWIGLALLLTAQAWDIWRLRLLKRQNACTA